MNLSNAQLHYPHQNSSVNSQHNSQLLHDMSFLFFIYLFHSYRISAYTPSMNSHKAIKLLQSHTQSFCAGHNYFIICYSKGDANFILVLFYYVCTQLNTQTNNYIYHNDDNHGILSLAFSHHFWLYRLALFLDLCPFGTLCS